jgi:uncharacterized protein (TIGR03083 family)
LVGAADGHPRGDLLALLDQLTADEWTAASPAHGWTVKDVAAHLLDGDLGRLSRDRDRELTGLLPVGGSAREFADALAAKNQRWVDAGRQLSGRVVRDLLVFSTGQLHAWTQDVDLVAPRQVSWASEHPVPAWLDLARELTETWVHHQQTRVATGRPAEPLSAVEGLMAATALVHNWTFVTRNTRHVIRTGVRLINPFEVP